MITMAYVTGTISDLENRLHQLSETTGILQTFIEEGRGYISVLGTGFSATNIPPQMSGKWEKEARQINFRIGQSGESLLEQQF